MVLDGGVKLLSRCLAAACLLAGPLTGEVVLEYDADERTWPKGIETLDEATLEAGVCVKAPADVWMGGVDQAGLFGTLFTHPMRYAVAGDAKRSVTLKQVPQEHLLTRRVITVAVGRKSITVFELIAPEPGMAAGPPEDMVTMNKKLDKIEEFNELIKKATAESQAAGEIARAVLIVNSQTSFGEMVDTLKLIQKAGCHHGLVMLNDQLAAVSDIEVRTDPEVKPPIAKHADLQKNKAGRIVVNVRPDGTYTADDFTILPDEGAIQDYVKKARVDIEKLGITPRLHLRGDKEALFKHGQVAVRAAAAAGVNQVLFATFNREPNQDKPAPKPAEQPEAPDGPRPGGPGLLQNAHDAVSSTIKPRESNLSLLLPGPADEADKEPETEPFLIRIEGKGRIFAGEVELDRDPNVRELPLLTKALEFYKKGVDAVGEKPLVQIYATDEAEHQRVIDVLNALAGVGINSVTFTDMTEEKEDPKEK